jgi:hypothetical protein
MMKLTVYALLLLAGCATSVSRQANKTLLDFLEDGKTTREMVGLKLGPPRYGVWPGTIEGEKTIFYRLGRTNEGYFILDPKTEEYMQMGIAWLIKVEGPFSLVLIFDGKNVLKNHSLVQVR